MNKQKGIVIVACKNPYYGKMAYNLTASIKVVEPDMPVVVLTSGRGLNHLHTWQKSLFDEVVYDDRAEALGCGAKLLAYSLSPFEQTLVIDADNLWLPGRQPSALFDELAGHDFTAITEGYYDLDEGKHDFTIYTFWGRPAEMAKAWNLKTGRLYQHRSEVFYFEKGETAKRLFKKALEVFRKPRVAMETEFNGGTADEFALNIAAAIYGLHPHRYKWYPTWWERADGRRFKLKELTAAGFWILSTGGNISSGITKSLYDNIAGGACYKLGVPALFKLTPKAASMNERKDI